MEACPESINPFIIEWNLRQLENIRGINNLHIWSINDGRNAISVCITVAKNRKEMKKKIIVMLRNYGLEVVGVEVEENERENQSDLFQL